MNCFNQRLRRTAPLRGVSSKDLVPSKPARMNGWSWPPQLFQVIGWLVYSYLAIVSFGIYIPLLPQPWNHVAYALMGVAFFVHFLTHVTAVSIDPADASVRTKQNYTSPMPLFDRTKQPHVIQNLHCYLCDVRVGPKVKHCGVCNKCVEDFDHHCKWLNNCVGGRNYRFFFVALSSAAVGIILLVVIVLFVFIQHYLNPHSLRTAPQFDSSVLGNTTWLVFLPLAPVKTNSAGLLTLAFVTVMLSFTCLVLLGHLLGFHIYLFYKGISTYDYVKMQRQKEARSRDTEAGNRRDSKSHKKSEEGEHGSVDCEPTFPQSSSSCQFDRKGPLASRLSESLCSELETFHKSSEKENSLHYGTEDSIHRTRDISMTEMKSWKPDDNEEAQNSSAKSPDNVPGVQDPLGSSVMTPDDA
ncbi:unnamed protein product [Ophioblennius macclurei]